MESAVANLIAPGEPAVVASCGKFGERWAELCDAYGADTDRARLRVGREGGSGRRSTTRSPPWSARRGRVFVTQSETSTGVVNDIRALNEVVTGPRVAALRRRGLRARRGRPAPGRVGRGRGRRRLAEVADVPAGARVRLGLRAGDGAVGRARPGPLLPGLAREPPPGQKEEPPNSAFTPAVTLFRALDVALDLMLAEGLERRLRPPRASRPRGSRRDRRAGARALRPRRPERERGHGRRGCPTRSTAPVPKLMRDSYGVTIAGGQGHLKGKIARIAHCGYYGAFDIVIALTRARDGAARPRRTTPSPGPGSPRPSACSPRPAPLPTPVG